MNSSAKYQLNKLIFDDFNRPSGILLLNKPSDISSHDLVDQVRRKYNIKQVGHAGALDVFSSGLMLILVGKATKLSNEILNWDKAYKARIVLGLFNYTQDPEGEIIRSTPEFIPSTEDLLKTLESFKGKYNQFVSIYSSVKVKGVKLRKILRDSRYSFEVIKKDDSKDIVIKRKDSEEVYTTIAVPQREITIYDIKLLENGSKLGKDLPFKGIDPDKQYGYCDIYVKCSKGTYIRQLAEDIGNKLGTDAILATLERTELGILNSSMAINLEDL